MRSTRWRRPERIILGYLVRHPGAQDTLEGIVEWWCLEERVRELMQAAEQAVESLAAAGLLVKRAGADGRVLYRVNPARLPELEAEFAEPARHQSRPAVRRARRGTTKR